jgi:hypothetical protein
VIADRPALPHPYNPGRGLRRPALVDRVPEATGELVEVEAEVDPYFEVTEIVAPPVSTS